MLYDLNNEKKTVYPNFKGGEGEFIAAILFDGQNKIIRGTLQPGSSIGEHVHEGDSEITYFLSGTATVLDDGKKYTATAGECHYCPCGHRHGLENHGSESLEFFAVVPVISFNE